MGSNNDPSDEPVTLFTVPDPEQPDYDQGIGESLFSGRDEGGQRDGGAEGGGLFAGPPGEGGGDGERSLFPELPEREVQERAPDMPDLNDLPDATGVDRETYFRQPETQRSLRRVARAAQQNPEQYTSEELNVISSLTQEAGRVLSQSGQQGGQQGDRERRPRSEVEEQGFFEGLGSSLMRGINRVQSAGFRIGELGSDVIGLESAESWFEEQAEDELEEGAAYERSERVVEVQRKMDEQGILETFEEDPVGAARWLSSKAVETSPTFGAAAAGQSLQVIPGIGQYAGAMIAGMALETGFQLNDAHYNAQGLERQPSGEELALATISGMTAGGLEGLGAVKAVPLAGKIDDVVRSALPEEVAPEALQEIGRRVREFTAEKAGRVVADAASQGTTGASAEALTEGLQGIVTDVGAKYGWDPERDVGAHVFQEALIGGTVGGVAGTARGAVAGVARSSEERNLEEAAREVPLGELRQMLNQADDPQAQRTIARVYEERVRTEGPPRPSPRGTEEASPVREGSEPRAQLQEALQNLREERDAQEEEAGTTSEERQRARQFGRPITEDTVQEMSVAELAARTRTATLGEQQVIAQELSRLRRAELGIEEEQDVGFDEEARVEGPIPEEELRKKTDQSLATRAEESDSQEETDQILAELMRRAEQEEAPEQVAERERQSQRLGELHGRRVEVSVPWGEAQGTLDRDAEGNFVARIPQEEVPEDQQTSGVRETVVRVAGARRGELGPTAQEAGVRVFPEPTVSLDPESNSLEVEEEGEVRVYEDIEINEDDTGEPVSITYQTPQGEQRTTRRPEIAERAALEQDLAQRGVEPEPTATEGEGAAQAGEAVEGEGAAGEEAAEADVPEAPVVEYSPETVRNNLSEVERESLTDREQTALLGALLSGLSDVEATLDAAWRGEQVGESVSEADLEQAETWLLERMERVREFLEGNISEGGREVAEKLRDQILPGMAGDLDRMRQELQTRPETDSQQDTDQQDGTQPPTPGVSQQPPGGPAPTDAGPAAQQAAEGDQTVSGQGAGAAAGQPGATGAGARPTGATGARPAGPAGGAQPRARRGRPGGVDLSIRDEVARQRRRAQRGGRPQPAEQGGAVAEQQPAGEMATGQQVTEAVQVLEEAVRERGFSPQVVDVATEELQNPESAVSTREDIERARDLASALREASGAPTVRPGEMRTAFNIINEGSIRDAINAAEDPDLVELYNETLSVLDRSPEGDAQQQGFFEDLEQEPESPEAQRVQGEIDETRSKLEEVQAELERRRRELAQAYNEQFEQRSGFEDADAEELVQVEITEEGFQRGSGPGGFVTPEDVREAQQTLENLIAERDRLQQKMIRLEREGDQMTQQAEEAQAGLEFEETINEEVRNETSTTVTKSGSDESYSVGFAEAPIRRMSGDQVTFQRQAGQLLVLNPEGEAVSRQSSNHDDAVLSALTDPDGIIDEYLSPERSVAHGAGTQQGATAERVAQSSQDPFEIAQAWLDTDPSLNAVEEAVEGRRFSPESVVDALERATVSLDQDPNTGYSLWKDAGRSSVDVAREEVEFADTSNVGAVDEVANILADRLGTTEEKVIEQIGNIIARHSGQNENIQTEGARKRRRLNERFKEVMGFGLGSSEQARAEFADRLIEARTRMELVQQIREAQADRENGADIMEEVVRTMERKDLTPAQLLEEGPLSIGDRLTETQRRALRIAWDEYHVDPEGGLPFMRLEGAVSGISADVAFEIIDNVASAEASIEGLPEAEVVRSPNDLPEDAEAIFTYHAGQHGAQLVQPAFVRGDDLYIVASHLAAAAEAQNETLADFTRRTLLHEWAHQGMESLWGDSYEEVMAGLYDEIGAQEIQNELGSNYDARFRGEVTPADKAFLADEYLAHQAENMVESTDPSIMRRIVLYFKRAWERLTGTTLGDAEVGLLLISAYEAARVEATAAHVSGTKFMMVGPEALRGFNREGAFVNPYDGLLRDEISDLGAELQGGLQTIVEEGGRVESARQELEQLQTSGPVPGDVRASIRSEEIGALSRMETAKDELSDGATLEDVLDHPRLYRAYPSLRDITVRYDPDLSEIAGTTYDPTEITLGNRALFEDGDFVQGVLLHEAQHQIQNIEGWNTGANYQDAMEIIRGQAEDAGINTDDDAAVMNWAAEEYGGSWQEAVYTVYQRVSGEIEARETQQRRQMNALERAVQPPFVRDGELVIPADEAFTQTAVPDQTPSLDNQRDAYDQVEEENTEPDVRFSRKPGADPTEEAAESVREDLEAGVIDLSDVVPVQTEETPELVAAGRPPVPDAPMPAWADIDPETDEGQQVVSDIESDPGGEETGVRSIIQMAVEQIFPEFEVLEASYVESANADFQGIASMLYRRLRSDGDAEAIDWRGWADQIQQIGRGRTDETLSEEEIMQEWVRLYVKGPGLVEDLDITQRLEDALDELDPAYLKTLRDAARAWDAHTDRSVAARLLSYNTDRGVEVDPSTFGGSFQRFLTSAVTRGHAIDKIYRDLYNVTRQYAEQDRAFRSTLLESMPIIGESFEGEGAAEARRVLSDAQDEEATPWAWYEATNRVNGEIMIAFEGRSTGESGFRITKTDTTLTEAELDRMEEAGLPLDAEVTWTTQGPARQGTLREALQEASIGHQIWLDDRTVKEITSEIDNWGDFEEYARRKVDLARAERPAEIAVDELSGNQRESTLAPAIRAELDAQGVAGSRRQEIEGVIEGYVKGMPDATTELLNTLEGIVPIRDVAWLRQQGIDTDVTLFPGAEEMGVPQLRETVAQFESQNPEWEGVFRELEDFADRILLAAVAGGMKEASEAARMKEAYRAYLPLARDIEGGGAVGGAGAWPDPSFREVKGSTTPAKNLLQNFKDRMRQVLDAYYHNASMVSLLNMLDRVAADESAPFATRELARQTVEEVGRIPRRVADLQPGEIRSIIAEGLDVRPQDIEIVSDSRPIFRAKARDGQDIIAPLIDGERVFYRVDDPILLQYFTLSGDDPGGLVQGVADMLAEVVQPWKRVLTGNAVFALRNGLARDPAYASFVGLDPEADNGTVLQRAKQIAPLAAQTIGLVERVTGTEITDESAVGEMFVDVIQNTGGSEHMQRADLNVMEQMKGVVWEGIWHDDYFSLSIGNQIKKLPGILMNIMLKPVELVLWGTGQRQFSIMMEENTRLGAHAMAREAGQTPLQAQRAYDRIAGPFGRTPANSTIHSIYRQAGFANPALQATYEMFRGVFSYDPKVRRIVLGARVGAVASMTAIAWAINEMFTPDDRQEELRERSDEEKMTTFPFLGQFRVPFDYGFVGTIQALTYNLLERQAGRGEVSKSAIADRILRSAYDVPLLQTSGLINPQLQTIREWQANYNFFWGEPIVPPAMNQYQPPPEQAFSDTPGTYKWLGKKLGASPLKIQHLVANGFSYQTDEFMQFVSAVRRGESEPTDILKPWDPDNPVLSRLWQRDPIGWRSRSVQEVSNKAREFDAAENQLQNLKENMPADPSPGYRKRIRELQDRMRELVPYKRTMKRVDAVWQRADQLKSEGEFEAAKEREREMTDIARTFLQEREQEQ